MGAQKLVPQLLVLQLPPWMPAQQDAAQAFQCKDPSLHY